MSKRILVAYASGTGSTAEVARAIGDVLQEETVVVEIRHVDEVNSLEPYSAVVVGSSIRAGRWLPEARVFVEELSSEMRDKPVAYFTTCLTMIDDTAESRRVVLAYLDPILRLDPAIKPVGLGLFAGSLDPARRLVLPAGGGPQGDYRDWEAIRSWAREIRPALLAEAAGVPGRVADLQGAVLSFTDLAGSDLSRVDLRGAELESANLAEADLEASRLNWTNFTESELHETNLHRANLIGAILQDADLRRADLSEAIPNGADLTGADLSGANLARADINWADLSGANLRGANLEAANLSWANLTGAHLEGASFAGARYNEHTRWPEGFSPEAAGAINIGNLPL